MSGVGRITWRWLRAAAASILLLGIAACATPSTNVRTPHTLTVVTLNLWHDKADWPTRQAHIAMTLRTLRPDVIVLQEVLQHAQLPNQAQALAEALGYRQVFASVDAEDAVRRCIPSSPRPASHCDRQTITASRCMHASHSPTARRSMYMPRTCTTYRKARASAANRSRTFCTSSMPARTMPPRSSPAISTRRRTHPNCPR